MPNSTPSSYSSICAPACNLARNLCAGLRLVLFLPVARDAFAFHTGQAIMLLGLTTAIHVGYDAAIYWPIGDVHAYGLGAFLLHILALLGTVQILAWGLTRFHDRDWGWGWLSAQKESIESSNPEGEAQVLVLAGLVWVQVVGTITTVFAPWPVLPLYAKLAVSLAFTGVWGLVAARALRMTTRASWPLALACGAVAAIAVVIVGKLVGGAPVFSRVG